MLKRCSAILLLLCLTMTQAHAQVSVNAPSGNLYDEAVTYVRQKGIASGYPDGSFGTNRMVTRAELVKMLMTAGHVPGAGSSCFSDVQQQWFAGYVCAARAHGMVTGYPDGSFRPGQYVTLMEAAALVVREIDGPLPSGGGTWYTPYVLRLQEWDAIPPTVRAMNSPLTRGETAFILWRASETQIEVDAEPEPEPEPEPDGNDPTLSLSVTPDQVAAGTSVTALLTVQNEDSTRRTLDVTVTARTKLEIREAPGAQRDASRATWRNLVLDAGGSTTLVLVAVPTSSLVAGETLELVAQSAGARSARTVRVRGIAPETSLGDPVLRWNAVALQANADDHTGIYGAPEQGGPGASSRALAIVHAAVYDAVNSIDRSYQPYIALVPVPSDNPISADAAVAVAAHRTLFALYPKQRAVFDAALQGHLSLIPEGTAKAIGQVVGETAAAGVLQARVGDGALNNEPHVFSQMPGRHRPDPINPLQLLVGVQWGYVKPFVIRSGTQFRAPPAPALTSSEYAAAFNEVKRLGGDGVTTPTERTQEQTNIGLFWAYDGVKKIGTPPRLFNQIVRQIAQQKSNTVVQNARLFALINLAQADAGIGCWESKYLHDYWRPVVGIREADAGTGPSGLGDNNPLTAGDAAWTPLGAPMSNSTALSFTPPFPAYPSGHATFGAAVFRTVELFYGTDEIPFTFVSDELNGVTTDQQGRPRPYAPRSFARLSDATRENAQSRIYLGVHWQFDATSGMRMGTDIADYTFANALRPVR